MAVDERVQHHPEVEWPVKQLQEVAASAGEGPGSSSKKSQVAIQKSISDETKRILFRNRLFFNYGHDVEAEDAIPDPRKEVTQRWREPAPARDEALRGAG